MKQPFVSKDRLVAIAERYPTPFHLYDEAGIRRNVEAVLSAFSWNPGFREYFAVKANPNPSLIKILLEYGCGCDCSSYTELMIADALGVSGEKIMFSSNDTPAADFRLARELDVPGAKLLATALVISHRTGSPLRDLLMRSAVLAERQGEFERMLIVKTAQVRLSVRIVCLLPVVMIAILALISPDFQAGLLTPVGMGCVALASLLDGTALLLIRRLMSGVLRWT